MSEQTTIKDLLKIMECLRDPAYGCPWDLEQDFQSIAPHTLEEIYEVIDTIERSDYEHLPNELGDLLFQVVFYAQLGKEQGLFDFNGIIKEISHKLLTRHPHVFPDATIESFGKPSNVSSSEVEAKWEEIKQNERNEKSEGSKSSKSLTKSEISPSSVLDDVPLALPALLRAGKIQKRASNTGFDWDNTKDVIDKLKEEISELELAIDQKDESAIKDELGDVLFSVVNLSRHVKQEPEEALRFANQKFEKRFKLVEKLALEDKVVLSDLSIDQLEEYWQRSKKILSE